jgi:Bacterial capsule synthesis protein PGA_cap
VAQWLIVGGHSVAQLKALVGDLRQTADAVIVLIHWGNEYQATPTADDRALARVLIDAGVLAVIGTHPHVLQPVEWVERADGTRGVVAFSLGNLVSNQDFDDAAGRRRDSVLLELTLEKAVGQPALLSAIHGVPVATENRLGGGKLRNVQPVLLDDEIFDIDHRLSQLNALPAEQVKVERLALLKKRTVAAQRLERIRAVLGPAGSGAAPGPSAAPVGQR